MRLLTKTFLYYITFAAGIFAVGGIISYFLIGNIFYKQLDEGMITEKDIIAQEISSNSHVPDYSSRFGHQIEVVLLNRELPSRFYLKDTIISSNNQDENFRYLYFSGNRSGKRAFTIEIFHPLNETTNLIEDILLVTFIMFTCLFLVLIAVNYFVSRRIWVPFYNTIGQLSRYNINEKDTLSLTNTTIYEFTVLNRVINDMSEKIMTDYFNMKEFTENASHEIQTPLAVIKSKVEMLLQAEMLDKFQFEALQTINDSVTRLTRLNAGLVLLSKIENRQFTGAERVNLLPIVDQLLEELEDLIEMKGLKVRKNIQNVFELTINPELAGIFLSNLISNAIKHNVYGGYIEIIQDDDSLMFRNSGLPLSYSEKELFNRFSKNQPASRSLGLGLAIVKKICEQYRISYDYTCVNSVHTFVIKSNLAE